MRLRAAGGGSAPAGFAAFREDQLAEFEIRSRVLPNVEILRQTTSLNAELLGRSGEPGTVALGAFADPIVVGLRPGR